MINPEWLLQDLDPRTWRAIGHLFPPAQYVAAARPGEHGLFVLHEAGTPRRIADTRSGIRQDLNISAVTEPRQLAVELFARGEWDRVHVIDRRHLAHVAAASAANPQPRVSLDEHYHRVYELLWDGSDGYVCHPPRGAEWYGWTYTFLQQFLTSVSASPAALALIVLEDDEVHIGLALEVRDARVQRVTGLEGLPPLPAPAVSDAYLDALWSGLEAAIAPPAAALVCTRSAFEACLYGPTNKAELLQFEAERGNARWRVAAQVSSQPPAMHASS
jgi:hypothetical protein